MIGESFAGARRCGGLCCRFRWARRTCRELALKPLGAGMGLVLIGGYHLLAGYPLELDEREALVAATREVGFPVGHASAQMGWRGLRSRPTWRILLYSADDPPAKRGLVQVDGVDGEIVSAFVEDNPEDWSEYE